MEFGQKNIREIDLFDSKSFFGLDFFKFSGPLYGVRAPSLDNVIFLTGYPQNCNAKCTFTSLNAETRYNLTR